MVDAKTIQAQAEKHGFTLRDSSSLPEISGDAYLLDHVSGARVLYLANDDNDKGFSVSFKTPASDDTGVFHILEHSVLCGSEKFSVKEPFVNLLKSSMETFLNAMTFPDKTMYPVSSTNEQDLLNLANVYMDAVFHPLIYTNKRIFEQEGWHIEIVGGDGADAGDASDAGDGADALSQAASNQGECNQDVSGVLNDAASGDASGSSPALAYNGVVFNEMKGALSDPDSVLADTLSASLFPHTTYRFESGGDPASIPTLTYEAFLENHRRHYRVDNAYIVLYGNLDIEKFLAFLDGQYLSKLQRSASPLPEIAYEPSTTVRGVRREMATAPENACCAYGYVAGRSSDRERMLAVGILLDAIMGSNVSPMKRALLDADIADDVNAYLSDSILQPYVVVSAKGLHENAVEKLDSVLRDVAESLSGGGLDPELIKAALARAEFEMREANFGVSDGVVYAMASLAGWLYEDTLDAACAYIRYEDAFRSLHEKADTGYFQDLMRELFIDNGHTAQVEVVPVAEIADPNKERLEALAQTMTAEDLTLIAKEVEALRIAQERPDSPEDLAKLPKLGIDEIGDPAKEPATRELMHEGVEVLRHDVDTHGILYASHYFDLTCLSIDELPYATILADMLGKADTSEHTALELDLAVQKNLGSLGFTTEVFDNPAEGFKPKFIISASALSDHAKDAGALVSEILTGSDFHDATKLRDVLMQHKVALESYFANYGNTVASLRAASYYSKAAVLRDRLTNIDFYVFLKDLLCDLDGKADGIAAKLDDLAKRIFLEGEYVLSFAGSDEAFLDYVSSIGFGRRGDIEARQNGDAPKSRLNVCEPKRRNEAFIVPTDVTYTALSGTRDYLLDKRYSEYSGVWLLASRILTFNYLWNEVRVKGGAYGVNFSTSRPGNTTFSSYRDPHIDETIARFEEAGMWLSSIDFDEGEFEGYQVSTAATFDKPLKPRDLVRRQDLMHFSGYTRQEYLENRKQVIQASQSDVRALGPSVGSIADERNICVIGNRKIIEESHAELNASVLYGL